MSHKPQLQFLLKSNKKQICRSASQPSMNNNNGGQIHNDLEHTAEVSSNLSGCYDSGIPRQFFLFFASASELCSFAPDSQDVLRASGNKIPSCHFAVSLRNFLTEQTGVAVTP
jgi:hypothetical protein